MSATPTPTVRTVGHPVRYPLLVGEVYRATCRCHWWQPVRFVGVTERQATA